MKIAALSDLHGFLGQKIEHCDLCIIAGDVVPLEIQLYSKACEEWFENEFKEWAESLDCEKVLFVAGNHDFFCERYNKKMHDMFSIYGKVTYLKNELYEYTSLSTGETLKIYGSPMSHKFRNWAFMQEEDSLRETFKDIPSGLDILLIHDAPYGVSDICFQSVNWGNNNKHIGSEALREAILEKTPRYCIHGHLHSSNHEEEMLGDTKVYNVSIKDEHYYPLYQPLYLEISSME